MWWCSTKLGAAIATLLKKEMARTRVAMRNEKAPKKKGGKRKKKRGGLKFDPMRCDQLPCPVAPRAHSHSLTHPCLGPCRE